MVRELSKKKKEILDKVLNTKKESTKVKRRITINKSRGCKQFKTIIPRKLMVEFLGKKDASSAYVEFKLINHGTTKKPNYELVGEVKCKED
jgi:hypothetical protein